MKFTAYCKKALTLIWHRAEVNHENSYLPKVICF
jgi:hypothetical protein